jgi:hypothetical protein
MKRRIKSAGLEGGPIFLSKRLIGIKKHAEEHLKFIFL